MFFTKKVVLAAALMGALSTSGKANNELNNIYWAMIQKGLLTKSDLIQTKKDFDPDSNEAKRIVFTKQNKCTRVVKFFKEAKKFNQAIAGLDVRKAMIVGIADAALESCEKIPQIILPDAYVEVEGEGVTIQMKAKGKPLAEYDIYSMSHADIKRIFSSVGHQTGNLHRLSLKHFDGMLLKHPDSHGNNVFYDEKTDQVYWIDVDNIKLQEGESNALSSDMLFKNFLGDKISDERTYSYFLPRLNNNLTDTEKATFRKMAGDSIVSINNPKSLAFLQNINNDIKKKLIDQALPTLGFLEKKIVAAEAYGKSYTEALRTGKEIYNKYIEINYQKYLNLVHYLKILGWQGEVYPDPKMA